MRGALAAPQRGSPLASLRSSAGLERLIDQDHDEIGKGPSVRVRDGLETRLHGRGKVDGNAVRSLGGTFSGPCHDAGPSLGG